MGTRGRRLLTATVVGLLLAGGCTAVGPRRQPPDRVPPGTPEPAPALPGPPEGEPSRPAEPAPPTVHSPTRSADRVLGVVWHGDPAVGNTTATLSWLDATSLGQRPGRRLRLGNHGVGWTVAPDQSLALFAAGGDSNDGRLLVVDPGACAGWARSGSPRPGGSGRTPPAGSAARGCCWPARASSRGRSAT
jgi:hypothetical protein